MTKSPSSLAAHLGLGPRSSGCHLSYPLLFPMASCCIQRLNHFLPGPDSVSSQVAPAQVCRSSSWRSSCPAADRSQQGSGGEQRQHLGERNETPGRLHGAASWQGRGFRPPGGRGLVSERRPELWLGGPRSEEGRRMLISAREKLM